MHCWHFTHAGTPCKDEKGVPPRGDRKSAEALENRGDSGAPLRKRVRNCMKIQGCRDVIRNKGVAGKRDRPDERVTEGRVTPRAFCMDVKRRELRERDL